MLSTSLHELPDPDSLAEEWMALERRASSGLFLSWLWIGTWLETYQPRAKLLRVYRESGDLVGLAIFGVATRQRLGVLKREALFLNQTGRPTEDQIWIEYNGILADRNIRGEVYREAALNLLSCKQWDEFILAAIKSSDLHHFNAEETFTPHIFWSSPTHGVNLRELRENDRTYLSSLSRNTRYQINRSIRLYKENFELRIRKAESLAEAQQMFAEIAPLHIKRWGRAAGESGFANPLFVAFHERLIERGWDQGSIQLCRVECGDRVISYLYNFVHDGTVHFYLSGFTQLRHAAEKPGLVTHALCIQDYADKGLNYYDFMGGGERYKSNLAKSSDELISVALQRKGATLQFESLLRGTKRFTQRLVNKHR